MGVCEGWLFQGPLDKEVSGALKDLSFGFFLEFKISCHEYVFLVMRQKKSQLDENIRKTREEKQKMEIPKVKYLIIHGYLHKSTCIT